MYFTYYFSNLISIMASEILGNAFEMFFATIKCYYFAIMWLRKQSSGEFAQGNSYNN